MKISEGASLRASEKYASANLLLSPYHLLKSRARLTHRKVKRASRAIARTSIVLPVPGGPCSRIPFGDRKSFDWAKSDGLRTGRRMACCSCFACSESPPISAKVTSMSSGQTTSAATSISCSRRTSSILPLPLSNRRATAEAFVVRSLEMRGSSLRIARCMMYALMPTNVRLIMRSTSKAAGTGMLRPQSPGRGVATCPSSVPRRRAVSAGYLRHPPW